MRSVMAAVPLVVMTNLAILTAPLAASAAGDDDVARELADESFQSGVRLFKKGDYQRALIEFAKANAVYPRGATMRNLGLCELKLGKPLDALKHFRGALQAADTKPEQRELAKQDLEDAYAQTGHILVHSNNGTAVLFVDGADKGQVSKEPVDVVAGHHVVEARVGPRTARAEVDATAGTTVTAEVSVSEPSPDPSLAPAVPSAAVAPSIVSEPAPLLGEKPVSFWNARREVAVVVGAVGVASFVLSGVFAADSKSAASRAASLRGGSTTCTTTCTALDNAYSSQNSDATSSWVFLGIGIAGAVAGAVLLLWPSTPSGARTSIEPFALPQGGGFQVHGEL